jgi:hypothetical protein
MEKHEGLRGRPNKIPEKPNTTADHKCFRRSTMQRFFAAVVAAVLIIAASSALAQQATVAEQVVNRYLAT